jgi:hypothetical protein
MKYSWFFTDFSSVASTTIEAGSESLIGTFGFYQSGDMHGCMFVNFLRGATERALVIRENRDMQSLCGFGPLVRLRDMREPGERLHGTCDAA